MNLPCFKPLTGIYEPSAIQQLPDGRFLVVEDEKLHPFSILSLDSEGKIEVGPVEREANESLGKLDDLEGLALDASGNIYTITSHSRNGEGETKKSREKLVRLRIDGQRIVSAAVCRNLKAALCAAHPLLAKAAEVLDVKQNGGFNIEAIEIAPDSGQLLIGFRSPLQAGRSLIARIENPSDVFDSGAAPRVAATLDTLDLGGHGLRGLSWLPSLGGYLVISGPVARESAQFRLWFWRSGTGDPARPVHVDGLPGFEHAEGVSPALIDGQEFILIVSDDGDRPAGRCARYLLLDPADLRIG